MLLEQFIRGGQKGVRSNTSTDSEVRISHTKLIGVHFELTPLINQRSICYWPGLRTMRTCLKKLIGFELKTTRLRLDRSRA